MFRFATGFDYFLMVIGSIAGAAVGAGLPAFAYLWGEMTDEIQQNQSAMVDAAL